MVEKEPVLTHQDFAPLQLNWDNSLLGDQNKLWDVVVDIDLLVVQELSSVGQSVDGSGLGSLGDVEADARLDGHRLDVARLREHGCLLGEVENVAGSSAFDRVLFDGIQEWIIDLVLQEQTLEVSLETERVPIVIEVIQVAHLALVLCQVILWRGFSVSWNVERTADGIETGEDTLLKEATAVLVHVVRVESVDELVEVQGVWDAMLLFGD